MLVKSFTLGDDTVVLITYNADGSIVSISSTNPVYFLLFGPDSQTFYIGEFENETFASLSALLAAFGL